MAKKNTTDKKPTGVNKGIKEGIDPEKFKGRVICKKCGKDIEFTLESELFRKCPRCGARVERDIEAETAEAKKIIKYDIMKRAKKFTLHFGIFLTAVALAWNITGFFTGLFAGNFWWLAMLSLPLIALSYALTRVTRLKSASKRYKFFAWLALVLNLIALAAVVVTAVPVINEKLIEWYNNL